MKETKRALVAAFGAVVLLATAHAPNAFGAVAKEVNAKASSTFEIDPSRDFEQYYGDVDYTKVTPEDPKNGKVPKGMADSARLACEDLFVTIEDDDAGYSGFKIFHENGEVNSNTPNWRVVTEGGNWISRAFNQDPDEEVTARGLFWSDPNYNFLRKWQVTSIRHKGKRVDVNCDAELELTRNYPATFRQIEAGA